MHDAFPRSAARRTAAALALVFLASACAGRSARREFAFPPPPDKPRIQWVRSFLSENDLKQSAWRRIWKALVPHDSSNQLTAPTGLALSPDETTLYVAVPHRRRVVAVDLQRGTFTAIGTSGRAPLGRPIGVAVDAKGLVYVSDKGANAIAVFAPDGSLLRKIGQETLVEPTGIALDRRNQIVYVVNDASRREGRHSVEAFSLAGKHLRTIGGNRSGDPGFFNFPRSVSVSSSGEVYVADMLNFRVQVFDAQGRLLRLFGEAGAGFPGQFDKIHSVGVDTFGNLYVADVMQGVHVLNPDGQPLMMFGGPVVKSPSSVVVDSKNTIFVADLLHAVHQFRLVNTKAEDSFARPPASSTKTGATAPASATPVKRQGN